MSSYESCLRQTLTSWELIVVDDASTDGTLEVAQKYAATDGRVQVIRNSKNLKLPKSLNVGFEKASGEYFTWISDDNLFRDNALLRMSDFLDANSGVDLVYSDYSLVDEDGQVIKICSVSAPSNLIVVNCIGGSFLYRRRVHEELNGYDEQLFMLEDYDFWLRAACKFRLLPLNEDLYLYRIHPDTLSAQYEKYIRSAHWKLVEERLPELGHHFPSYDCARSYIYLAYFAFNEGKRAEFFRHIKNAWAVSPKDAALSGVRFLLHQIRRRTPKYKRHNPPRRVATPE